MGKVNLWFFCLFVVGTPIVTTLKRGIRQGEVSGDTPTQSYTPVFDSDIDEGDLSAAMVKFKHFCCNVQ